MTLIGSTNSTVCSSEFLSDSFWFILPSFFLVQTREDCTLTNPQQELDQQVWRADTGAVCQTQARKKKVTKYHNSAEVLNLCTNGAFPPL